MSFEAAEPSNPTGTITLLAAPLAHWPSSLTLRLQTPTTLSIAESEGSDGTPDPSEPDPTLQLLGYCDPASGLAEALDNSVSPDVASLLDAWSEGCLQLLRRWREQPERHRLINLSRLDPAAEIELLRLLGLAADGPAETALATEMALEAVSPSPPQLPAVVAHYLAERKDVAELYADLEGCAELLGREPELAPAIPASPARGIELARQLLAEWQEQGSQMAESRQERQASHDRLEEVTRQQLQREAETAARIQTLEEERKRTLLHLRQAQNERSELEHRLHDLEEEQELILLQLRQVQDELSHWFQEHGKAREQSEALEQRLQALEQECRHLFLHSRLNPEIDRARIGTILQLVRETLQV